MISESEAREDCREEYLNSLSIEEREIYFEEKERREKGIFGPFKKYVRTYRELQ